MSDKLSNYIPISRKLFDHPFFTEPRTFSKFEAWLDLLQEARYDPKDCSRMIKNKVVTFSRGEIPASLRFLAERWNWSKNKVDSFIELLENEGMIKKRTAKGTAQTIITICKYEDYNSLQKITGQQKGHYGDSTGTAQGQNSNKVNKENKASSIADAEFIEPTQAELFLQNTFDRCLDIYFLSRAFQTAREQLAASKYMSVDRLREWADVFVKERVEKGDLSKSMNGGEGFPSHFRNWMKFRNAQEDPTKHFSAANKQVDSPDTDDAFNKMIFG